MPENEPCPQCSSLCDSCDIDSKVVPVRFKEKQILVDIDDREEMYPAIKKSPCLRIIWISSDERQCKGSASVLFGGLYVYDGNGVRGGIRSERGMETIDGYL
nr:hypothetical protein [Tanacetum cinerariifolium]